MPETNVETTGEMCWKGDGNAPKQLFLRPNAHSPWQNWCSVATLTAREIPVGSTGFSTCQALLARGWQLVSSPPTDT